MVPALTTGHPALQDIPETIAHQLHYLLSLLFESGRVFAASTVDQHDAGGRAAAAGAATVDAASVCRLWDKAQQLAVLLVTWNSALLVPSSGAPHTVAIAIRRTNPSCRFSSATRQGTSQPSRPGKSPASFGASWAVVEQCGLGWRWSDNVNG